MSEREPTIYIAGPMRGIEDFNFPAFDRQAQVLGKQGWKVINPAEMDRQDGLPCSGPMEYDPAINYEDREFMRDALKRDMVAICDECTAMYMMSDFETSRGARAEWHLAKALGLEIYYEAPLPSEKKIELFS
jgi:hypothetical protein|tara:strand:- start:713 stop:1108 length:396 start_codon:yes stop_codon:yes gene_type:complete